MKIGTLILALGVSLAGTALAHHIMGIPHYAYDEAYPQAPVITYSVEAGPYLVRVTGYPGKPAPGQLTEVHAYVVRTDDSAAVYGGPIEARIERDGLFGPEVAWGPGSTRFEENLHKFSPVFGTEGNYRIRLELELEDRPYEIDFPLVVGDPASPLGTLASWGGAVLFLVVAARAARIKLERKRTAAATLA